MIGLVIESLIENLYQHKFTQLPYNIVDQEMVKKILQETVILDMHECYTFNSFIYVNMLLFRMNTEKLNHKLLAFSIEMVSDL